MRSAAAAAFIHRVAVRQKASARVWNAGPCLFATPMQLHCLQSTSRAADMSSTDLAIVHTGHAVGRKLQQLPSMVVHPRVLVVLLVRLRAPELWAAREIRVNKWAQGAPGQQG